MGEADAGVKEGGYELFIYVLVKWSVHFVLHYYAYIKGPLN